MESALKLSIELYEMVKKISDFGEKAYDIAAKIIEDAKKASTSDWIHLAIQILSVVLAILVLF